MALLWWFYLAVGLPQCVRKAFVILEKCATTLMWNCLIDFPILLMKSCGFINTPWWWCAACCRRAGGSWGVWTRGEMANADFASVGAAVSAGKVTQLHLYFVSFQDLYWRRKSWSIRSSQKVMGVFFQPLIVDVRTEDEFAAGRIPGAINIPLSEVWMIKFRLS